MYPDQLNEVSSALRSDARGADAGLGSIAGPSLRRTTTLPILLVGLMCLYPPTHVSAFRTVADDGAFGGQTRVAWQRATVHFDVSSRLTQTEELLSAVGSFRQQLGGLSCAQIDVTSQLSTAPIDLSAHLGDGRNSIILLGSEWSLDLALPSTAMAVTEHVFRAREDGTYEIVESDVLLNGKNFSFSLNPGPDSQNGPRSLQAVLHHELAHALGMAHPCELSQVGDTPLCTTSELFAGVMMYPGYTGTSQQYLTPDDSAGLCFLYPKSTCPVACESGGACVEGTCVELCGSGTCGVGELCIDALCRAPCGDSLCANEDRCLEGACLASCGNGTCPRGMVCELGSCVTSCLGAPCAARACNEEHPCPDGLVCDGGACRTMAEVVHASCTRDRDCPNVDTLCRYGACVERSGLLGDPCVTDAACLSGLCNDAACTTACTAACDAPGTCVDGGERSYCEFAPELGAFGAACDVGSECISRQCLAVDGRGRACTRACTQGLDDDCPRGATCKATDTGTYACTDDAIGSGCSVSHHSRSLHATQLLCLTSFLFLFRRRRSARLNACSSRPE